ncbi:MAG: iron permease [Proteobacteria bacterium]|nr:MAG: iron permease [Pseudomonadota bacterium]QKK12014.1 MAG: FTR1 family iron permease [Pseudomonadota bacterium]
MTVLRDWRVLSIAVLLVWAGAGHAEKPVRVDFAAVVAHLNEAGDVVIEDYDPGNGVASADRFSDLYFDVFESSGMEQVIGLREPRRKTALEAQFAAVIGSAGSGEPREKVVAAWQALKEGLESAVRDFGQPVHSGFWTAGLQSFLILLREGFEAILVITALATYLRKVGAADRIRVIYHGVGWALVASLTTAYLLTVVLRISGAGQEALEGVTLLIAAAVLFYVSYWLISKREAVRWQAYVRGQIDKALSRGSLLALGSAAFLAVYREGAETALFYQALAGQTEGQGIAILAGFAAACLALAAVYWGMRGAAFRLPLGLFFAVTAALLYYLAVSFAGSGVLELQEAGWISITPAPGIPQWPWLGLFPSWEGVAAQGVLVVLALVAAAWWWMRRQRSAVVPSG